MHFIAIYIYFEYLLFVVAIVSVSLWMFHFSNKVERFRQEKLQFGISSDIPLWFCATIRNCNTMVQPYTADLIHSKSVLRMNFLVLLKSPFTVCTYPKNVKNSNRVTDTCICVPYIYFMFLRLTTMYFFTYASCVWCLLNGTSAFLVIQISSMRTPYKITYKAHNSVTITI